MQILYGTSAGIKKTTAQYDQVNAFDNNNKLA